VCATAALGDGPTLSLAAARTAPARDPRAAAAVSPAVCPAGRPQGRAERLGALPDRILWDIGLRRTDVQAAVYGVVRLCDLVRGYPSAGPLYVCGRPGFRSTLVRLDKAA
jgi:hypothetical protein